MCISFFYFTVKTKIRFSDLYKHFDLVGKLLISKTKYLSCDYFVFQKSFHYMWNKESILLIAYHISGVFLCFLVASSWTSKSVTLQTHIFFPKKWADQSGFLGKPNEHPHLPIRVISGVFSNVQWLLTHNRKVQHNQRHRTITRVNNENRKRWAIMLQIEVLFWWKIQAVPQCLWIWMESF